MPKPDRRIDPPRRVYRIRLVRASDTSYNSRVREQVEAVLRLVERSGGER
jgi:hypothetical protein